MRQSGCRRGSDSRPQECKLTNPVTDTDTVAVYEDLLFHPGDVVSIGAEGCVYSRDARRWISFADEPDWGKVRFARALAFIPGITMAFVPVADLAGRDFQIPRDIQNPGDVRLWLAYNRDTHTTDEHQVARRHAPQPCDDHPSAFIRLTWRPAVAGTAIRDLPFDLRLVEYDDNLLPKNPRWAGQSRGGTTGGRGGSLPSPARDCIVECAGQGEMGPQTWRIGGQRCTALFPYLDVGIAKPCRTARFAGHATWGPATFEGEIRFKDWQGPAKYLDNDFDFYFFPRNDAGLTRENDQCDGGRRYVETEVNNKETNFRSRLWKGFRCWATKRGRCDAGMELAGWFGVDAEAIVIGHLSLDSFHDGKSEIHPVFGMAVRDPRRTGDGMWNDDVWAIFVQNAARQGEFGKAWHYLDVDRLVIRLTGPANRIPEATNLSAFERNDGKRPDVRLFSLPGTAVLTIEMPRVIDKTKLKYVLVDGELHLRWKKAEQTKNPIAYVGQGSRPAVLWKEREE